MLPTTFAPYPNQIVSYSSKQEITKRYQGRDNSVNDPGIQVAELHDLILEWNPEFANKKFGFVEIYGFGYGLDLI